MKTLTMNGNARSALFASTMMVGVMVGALLLIPSEAEARSPRRQAATPAVHVSRAPLHVSSVETPRVKKGRAIRAQLPRGAKKLRVAGRTYWVKRGVFFQRTRRGFLVVQAPRGALLENLPRTWQRFSLNGRYFGTRDGVFCRWNPKRRMWKVVRPPKAFRTHRRASLRI